MLLHIISDIVWTMIAGMTLAAIVSWLRRDFQRVVRALSGRGR